MPFWGAFLLFLDDIGKNFHALNEKIVIVMNLEWHPAQNFLKVQENLFELISDLFQEGTSVVRSKLSEHDDLRKLFTMNSTTLKILRNATNPLK